ncbi:beta-mannosidase [Bacteroidota bacterium]|nr:beta-mannosidase [Bacteroidota bacterium]
MKKYFLILFFVTLSLLKGRAQDSSIVLTTNHNWEFLYLNSNGDSAWLPASNDLNIYSCLVFNKIIADPFHSSNSDSLDWVQHRVWKFRCHFTVPSTVVNKKNCSLQFKGLDTYAVVFLNGTKILEADNAFRNWEVDVKNILKQNENELLIVFKPVKEIADSLRKLLPHELPGSEYVFTRKPAMQFGWDFAPKLLGCGILKPIELMYWDDFRFKDIQLHQQSLTDTLAIINAELFYENNLHGNVEMRITDTFIHQTFYTRIIELNDSGKTTFHFEIKNPKRWWCNGYGEPYLFHLKFDLLYYNADTLFSVVKNYGARTIELIQTPDSIGTSFYFKLNGVPVFIKGANYVPSDALMRENISDEKNHDLILAANESHMNMLRVWGGGTYASDKFYNDCDANGIMVWQDFPFACAMYPGDSDFIGKIKDEATDNILRIRNHPSLAMWCGNNEIKEGWFNWDWQKQFHYSVTDSLKIWSDYQNLFEKTIPSILKSIDPQTPYWPSSPSIGWGHKESLQQGDVHYWGVWWGMEPFSSYINHTGRFVNEYGFQSFPSMNCLQQYLKPNELYLYSPALKTHQKHPTGFETIQTYLKRDYDTSTNFENYVYLSQLLQTEGMSTAIEAHRRAMPYCMGTLYWQLNDCWPAISWSSIDYAGNKKVFQYQLNRLYNTYLVSMVKNKNKIDCWIVSDSLINTSAQLQISLWNFSGKLLWQRNLNCAIDAQSSKQYFHLTIDSILKKYDSTEIVLHGELIIGDKKLSYADYFFASPKNLKLQNPEIKFKVASDKKYKMPQTISVSCNKPAFGVSFYAQRKDGNYLGFDLTDNYFSLFPDEKKEIKMKSMNTSSGIAEDFVNCKVLMKCLNEVK